MRHFVKLLAFIFLTLFNSCYVYGDEPDDGNEHQNQLELKDQDFENRLEQQGENYKTTGA